MAVDSPESIPGSSEPSMPVEQLLPSSVSLLDKITIALTAEQVEVLTQRGETMPEHKVVELISAEEFCCESSSNPHRDMEPCSLENIYRFCEMLHELLLAPSSHVVVDLSRLHDAKFTTASMLLGSYLILCEGANLEYVFGAIAPIAYRFVTYHERLTVHDCLRALATSRKLEWLDFNACIAAQKEPEPYADLPDHTIHMEEMIHYASVINGSLRIAIPGEVYVSPEPTHLPPGVLFRDTNGHRELSASFLAELYSDMGVGLVLAPHAAGTPLDAFLDAGLAVEEMRLGEDHGLLGKIDRFLSLVQLCPGSVALPVGGSPAARPWLVRSLLAACLIRRHKFDGPSAVAWLRMLKI